MLWIVLTSWVGMRSFVAVINVKGRPLMAFWEFCIWYWAVICSLGIFLVLKMLVSLNQYRATIGIFNNHTFVYTSKCKNLFSVRNSQDFCLIDCALYYSGSKFIFFILFLTLLTSKCNTRSGAKFFNTSSFITVVMNVWITIWLYIIFDLTK